MFGKTFNRIFSIFGFESRTIMYLKFDLRRLYTRLKNHRKQIKQHLTKLQLGSDKRPVKGWLNCDITGSDFDVDLAASTLPFKSEQFNVIVFQQVIEHLEFDPVALNLLKECYRILKHDGEIWLSCPDLEKMCKAYLKDKCKTLDKGRKRHSPAWIKHKDFPLQHRINYFFHQCGEHRNLMDFEMLSWALNYAKFRDIKLVKDADLVKAYPEFPPRNDDDIIAVVVMAKK